MLDLRYDCFRCSWILLLEGADELLPVDQRSPNERPLYARARHGGRLRVPKRVQDVSRKVAVGGLVGDREGKPSLGSLTARCTALKLLLPR